MLTAIYRPAGLPSDEIERRLTAVPGFGHCARADIRTFSNVGIALAPKAAGGQDAHYLAALDGRFHRAVMFDGSISVPPSAQCAAIVAKALRDMSPGAILYAPVAFAPMITQFLPAVATHAQNGGKWLSITRPNEIENDLANLRSCLPATVANHETIAAASERAGIGPAGGLEWLTYSLHWALLSAAIIEILFRRLEFSRIGHGLDVGGSTGLLCCELALKGHAMTNSEYEAPAVSEVMPIVAEMCGVHISGVAGAMQDGLGGANGRYDFICFMNSLLCCPPHQRQDVVRAARACLKPGGVILFRENLLTPKTASSGGRPDRFTPDQFRALLGGLSDHPVYITVTGAAISAPDIDRQATIFAGVRPE